MNEALTVLIDQIRSGKVILTCSKHSYSAAQVRKSGKLVPMPPEPRGCPDCLRAYFYTDWCMAPASTREQRLDELESVVRHAVEYDKTGKFGEDFELYDVQDPRFEVRLHKDAADDETGEDKKIIISGEELN